MKPATIATAVLMLLGTAMAGAADLTVMSSSGMSTMMKQLIPAFEHSSGHRVTISYDTSNIVMGRIKGGEAADLIILTGPVIDELAKQGKVTAQIAALRAGGIV